MSKHQRVSEKRLSGLLASSGFHRAARWQGGFSWSRWNSLLDVSEWVLLGFAGKKDEAVSASVGVGVTRTLAFGVDHRLLLEVADIQEMLDENGFWIPGRGRAITDTTERAKTWERRCAEVASAAAESYALQHANELLQRTLHARQRSSDLLRQLDPKRPPLQQIQDLEAQCGSGFRKASERLADWPGVMLVYDAELTYLLACCAVLNGNEGAAFIGQDPLKNDALMWQIQLVADGILMWHGS